MNVRIRMSRETVKDMMESPQKSYRSGDAAMMKRIAVLLDFSRGIDPTPSPPSMGIGVQPVCLAQSLVE